MPDPDGKRRQDPFIGFQDPWFRSLAEWLTRPRERPRERPAPTEFLGAQWPWHTLFGQPRSDFAANLRTVGVPQFTKEDIERIMATRKMFPPTQAPQAPAPDRKPPPAPTPLGMQVFDAAGWRRFEIAEAKKRLGRDLTEAELADIDAVVAEHREAFAQQKMQRAAGLLTAQQQAAEQQRLQEEQMRLEQEREQGLERQRELNRMVAGQRAISFTNALREQRAQERTAEIERLQAERQRQVIEREKDIEWFEADREQLLRTLTGPANEVERWHVKNAPNPFTAPLVDRFAEDIARLQESGKGRTEGGLTGEEEEEREAIFNEAAMRVAEQKRGLAQWESEQAVALATLEKGLLTPEWMFRAGFLPEVGATLPLKKGVGRVETPSGQQLTRLQPSQSQFLGGALSFFGGRPWQDILSEAELMMPRTPSRSVTRWRPVSQGRV